MCQDTDDFSGIPFASESLNPYTTPAGRFEAYTAGYKAGYSSQPYAGQTFRGSYDYPQRPWQATATAFAAGLAYGSYPSPLRKAYEARGDVIRKQRATIFEQDRQICRLEERLNSARDVILATRKAVGGSYPEGV